MKFPVFDLHCDTALVLLGRDFQANESLKRNTHHIDLMRAGKLDGFTQCFACFTTNWAELPNGLTAMDIFERELAVILRELSQNSDVICQAYTAEDVVRNQENGLMSGILTIEGPAGIGYNPARLEELYKIGFRMTTLGWNEKNFLTGSHSTGGGLTDLGKEYVKEAQRLGMIVDVSHISDEGFWDIMEISSAPVVASHSNSRFVHNMSRNLTDDMFRAICETGGVVGFNLFGEFIGEKPDMEMVCRHFLHFLELDPEGKHLALGGDLDGCDVLPEGFSGIQDYPLIAQKLLSYGLHEEMVYNIFWNNALGVMKRCCM